MEGAKSLRKEWQQMIAWSYCELRHLHEILYHENITFGDFLYGLDLAKVDLKELNDR